MRLIMCECITHDVDDNDGNNSNDYGDENDNDDDGNDDDGKRAMTYHDYFMLEKDVFRYHRCGKMSCGPF